jgi:hypothetical protein
VSLLSFLHQALKQTNLILQLLQVEKPLVLLPPHLLQELEQPSSAL